MSSTLMNHASSSSDVTRDNSPPQLAAVATKQPDPTIAQDAVARKTTRSFDYIWRSGVAGGFAGCAVRLTLALFASDQLGEG